MKKPGKYIIFEGINGCGKSTQIERLKIWLNGKGIKCRTLRELDCCDLGQHIDKALASGDIKNPIAKALLFQAMRAENISRLVKPLLGKGYWVLGDRSTLSSVVYQGVDGVDPGLISELNIETQQGIEPHITLLLNIPPKKALCRLEARDGYIMSWGERVKQLNKLRMLAGAYQDAVNSYRTVENLANIDANQQGDLVASEITDALISYFPDELLGKKEKK